MNVTVNPGTKAALQEYLQMLMQVEQAQQRVQRGLALGGAPAAVAAAPGVSGVSGAPVSIDTKEARKKEFNEHVERMRAENRARYAGMNERAQRMSARGTGRDILGSLQLMRGEFNIGNVKDIAEVTESVAESTGRKGLAKFAGRVAGLAGGALAGVAYAAMIKELYRGIVADPIFEKLERAGKQVVALEGKMNANMWQATEAQKEEARKRLDYLLATELRHSAADFKTLRGYLNYSAIPAALQAAEADINTRKAFLEKTLRVQDAGWRGAQMLEKAIGPELQSNSGPQKIRFHRPDLLAERIMELVRAGGTAWKLEVALRGVEARLIAMEKAQKEQQEEQQRWRLNETAGIRNAVLENQRAVWLRGVEEEALNKTLQWNPN